MPEDYKVSPNIQEHLVIHFYRPAGHTPWWMRIGWWPRFSHVAVEWHGLIHHLPYGSSTRWCMADVFLKVKPPDVSVPMLYRADLTHIADSVSHISETYKDKRVERMRVVLWRFGIRPRKPRSCGTLTSLWINLFTEYTVDAVMPDELFCQLMEHALREKARAEL